jgi:hypothetical protein
MRESISDRVQGERYTDASIRARAARMSSKVRVVVVKLILSIVSLFALPPGV